MIKAIKGTNDILPDEIQYWNHLTNIVLNQMNIYNYKEIRTPIFEQTELFSRGIGDSTDIVSKEMYTFIDRSENSLTLKPEMTASVVRAFIEHSLGKQFGLNKLFYISPMFRQERPQAGRFRQFHQFGIEAIGSHNPYLDAEVIQVAFSILQNLGLKDIEVNLNSLGIPEERNKFAEALKDFLSSKKNELSEDSKNRLESNVFRILDSKNQHDQELLAGSPSLIDFLGEESLEHFNKVKELLTIAKIPYSENHKLVRGLDYYTHTTFEILSSKVGAQSALVGGGRYNLLIEQLGGTSTPAVGFAAGIERILLACKAEESFIPAKEEIDIYLIRVDKELENKIFEIGTYFRYNNRTVEFDYLSRSVKAQMREANRLNSKFVLFVGGEEFSKGEVQLKNMSDGEQQIVHLNNLDSILSIIK
ncbi:MAG: histidine--tRNA ligase [Ignavibacteriales bacterium]|nr:histidine--tRNA ligase [Ignavibacteriota bacterium]MCB9248151.1 histidine--tRNA ligase [Ignavibacteriales bacterium]